MNRPKYEPMTPQQRKVLEASRKLWDAKKPNEVEDVIKILEQDLGTKMSLGNRLDLLISSFIAYNVDGSDTQSLYLPGTWERFLPVWLAAMGGSNAQATTASLASSDK